MTHSVVQHTLPCILNNAWLHREMTIAVSAEDWGQCVDIHGGVMPDNLTCDCYQVTNNAGMILCSSLSSSILEH